MEKIKIDGLSKEEVIRAREKYGSNALETIHRDTFFKQLLRSLGDPIIRILLIALGIKTIFLIKDFDWYETVGIAIAIFLASFISTLSEYGSEKAFDKLQQEAAKTKVKVKRFEGILTIPLEEIVVGDIVLLEYGEKIPADGVLLTGSLTIDESSITGESKEIYKYPFKTGTDLKETNQLFRGSVIYQGTGKMLVTKVGVNTFYGKIAKELQDVQPESPLKSRLRHLATIISRIGYCSAFFVALSYLFFSIVINNQFDINKIIIYCSDLSLLFAHLLYALTLAVTMIVVSVPEGLPMMITLVLSSNMKRMLKDNILVRKLVGIETSGSLNILFTDKTGTLTKGELEVVGAILGDGRVVNSNKELISYKKYLKVLDESLIQNNSCSYDKTKNKFIGGNATDQACVNFIYNKKPIILPKLKEKPFNSKDKYSKVTVNDNGNITYIKGSPELLLKKCNKYLSLDGMEIRFSSSSLWKRLEEYTRLGIRVILTGYSRNDGTDIVLLSLLLIKDELRKESKGAVNIVRKAGVQVVMITGDNKETATSIAKETGIISSNTDLVLTSSDMAQMSDAELKKKLPNLRVVARALPQDKSRLVRISEEENLVVGMTGDGVNDAPALKKADVGFAMNSGTEVAKEASDIILLDNNFYSITKAILYGRTIFKSIRKFIIFQLTVNFCAVFLSIIGPFIGVATPVTVIQMLWINMVMDTLAGIAFSYEAPLSEYMEEKPKDRYEPILNNYMIHEIVFIGVYSSLLCIFFLKSPYIHSFFRDDINDKYFLTAFFGLFIFVSIFNSFNARTSRLNIFANLFKNKMFMVVILFIAVVQFVLIYYGGELFRTVGLSFKEIEIMLLCAFSVIPVELFRKIYLKKNNKLGHV
ncbi:MAG: calcium-translocating P-type ATPase, PMCA-type [bacterium]|nr:calcium-translocating P-type ATPase, PMCA-type [bacterium]